MTPLAVRLLRAGLLLVCLVLAVALSRRHREAWPVAWALGAMAVLDLVRLLPLPPRVDAWVWLMWPAVVAGLAWKVWRGRESGAVLLAFAVYATALVLVPGGWWPAHALAWGVARQIPYWGSPALCLVAWATGQRARSWPGMVAGVLGLSGALDVAIGALAEPGEPWWLAWATSGATYALVGAILVAWIRASAPSPT